jgi:hypothetical protein
LDDRIKKNEMGGACSMLGGGELRVHTGFLWGNLRERGALEGPDIDEKFHKMQGIS